MLERYNYKNINNLNHSKTKLIYSGEEIPKHIRVCYEITPGSWIVQNSFQTFEILGKNLSVSPVAER